ncbi:hypothetical protein [Methyloterricola oryzae]|uniref:hypothetical protein n=1 Tax=Methyloterricola oryzae TaxID=1495050 RepID=UPI0005EBCF5E|nr:hypothetical protein [Methyloterricola oryzae]
MGLLNFFCRRHTCRSPLERLSLHLWWGAFAAAALIAAAMGWACIRFGGDAASAWQVSARPWLLVWRLLLFAALVAGWPMWIDLVCNACRMNGTQRALLLRLRMRLAVYLLAYEVLFNAAGFVRP